MASFKVRGQDRASASMGNFMNYEEYVRCQTVVHGQIEKPAYYHVAERKAIDHLFKNIPKSFSVLDVGCGSGQGMNYLRELGYEQVSGIELHPEKAKIAGAHHGDIASFGFPTVYDVIYCSHAFEHMFAPSIALERMMKFAREQLIFILPYVDDGAPKAHCASFQIGTRIDDGGDSVNRWFTVRGLELIEKKLDLFREPEIWLRYQHEKTS